MKLYRVAYIHPSVSQADRCYLCQLGPNSRWMDLLKQLRVKYPDSIEDLKGATMWKVGNLSVEYQYPLLTNRRHRPAILPKRMCV